MKIKHSKSDDAVAKFFFISAILPRGFAFSDSYFTGAIPEEIKGGIIFDLFWATQLQPEAIALLCERITCSAD